MTKRQKKKTKQQQKGETLHEAAERFGEQRKKKLAGALVTMGASQSVGGRHYTDTDARDDVTARIRAESGGETKGGPPAVSAAWQPTADR